MFCEWEGIWKEALVLYRHSLGELLREIRKLGKHIWFQDRERN